MAHTFDMKRTGTAVAATLLCAAMIFFGTGLHPFWPLMWFAMLPVLLFAADASWWAASLVTMLAIIAGSLNQFTLFYTSLHMPVGVILGIYASVGLEFALAVLLFRALLRRGASWSALLAFPALLVVIEYIHNLTSIHGTSASVAYSQLSFLPILQLASITGPWGVTFLLMLLAPALAIGWHLRNHDRIRAWRIVGASAGMIAAVIGFGSVRLAMPAHGPTVKVGLIASDGSNEDVAAPGAPTLSLLQHYADQASRLADQGAQAVVMPEKLAVVTSSELAAIDAMFQPITDHSGAVLVAGIVRVNGSLKYNQARIYRRGQAPSTYDKQHMLPPFESSLTPGTALTYFPEPSGIWGVEICKDMDFTPLARRYGEVNAGLMLVPGWDFVRDWVSHGHMAIMRGVESGFNIVRAAKGGSMYVSDSRGRVLAEVRSNRAPFATLLATVPTTHVQTLYVVLGDWFAWLSLAVLMFTLARLIQLAAMSKRRSAGA